MFIRGGCFETFTTYFMYYYFKSLGIVVPISGIRRFSISSLKPSLFRLPFYFTTDLTYISKASTGFRGRSTYSKTSQVSHCQSTYPIPDFHRFPVVCRLIPEIERVVFNSCYIRKHCHITPNIALV